MTKVAVLAGGSSDERDVSLRSGAAVQAALIKARYDVVVLNPAQPAPDYEQVLTSCDIVFPALHGRGGEDGTIQSWLETRHLPYVGADSVVSGICFDKWHYKQKLQAAGFPIPKGELVDGQDFQKSPLIQEPFVLKPYDGGSSVDTFIIRDTASADNDAIATAFTRHAHMLLEELIEGQEITVAVLGNEVLPVIEIIPPSDGEFDYENKYNGRTQELCPPLHISDEIQKQAQKLALQIHQEFGVHDMSRTDMMINKSGELYILETNTIPGLTGQSLLPKAAAAAGYSMLEMTSQLVEAALARYRNPA